MEYHVYWLLKSSCCEILEMENTIFFGAKKLMKTYLLITEKFSFWIFQEYEIRSFCEPKR